MKSYYKGKYQHYKGGYYRVLGEAIHEANNTRMIVYKSLDNGEVYCRNITVFFGAVTKKGIHKGEPRFVKCVSPIKRFFHNLFNHKMYFNSS